MDNILFIILGYLVGSIPTALIVSKSKNIDIRQHGSGNIGGTNTFRVLGKKAGYIVTSVDILKGAIITLIAFIYGGETFAALAGVAASIGHSFSIYAKFKGGKSVATSAGVMLILNPIALLIGVIVFILILFTTKYVSLSSMISAGIVVLYVAIFEQSASVKYATLFLVLFIIFRHYTNINRLLKGIENRAFQKNKK